MSTKLYSNKQERTVAEYLDWRQVSGSGSRPTVTGDIEGAEWLGECKTHTSPGHRIEFLIKTWDKIIDEASTKFKQACYIVDDGSQKIENTWVMFLAQAVSSRFTVVEYPYPIYKSTTFEHLEMKARTPENTIYQLHFGAYDVMICSLVTFSNLL